MELKRLLTPCFLKILASGRPRQFFPYVEYLSGLVFGPKGSGNLGTTTHALDFLTQFMNRVDLLYGQYAKILIHMWRHGLIHTYKPKVLQAASGGASVGRVMSVLVPTFQPTSPHGVRSPCLI